MTVRARLRALLARVRPAPEPPIPGRKLYRVLHEYGHAFPETFFVQVGANDGQGEDPLRRQLARRRWSGIMVEPVPYVFERLVHNVGDNPRVALENAAIADADTTRPIYFLAPAEPGADLPDYYDKLGSFDRDVLLKQRDVIPDIDARVRSLDVPCLTFESLCTKHRVERIDLVQIDTEGYDFEIIKLIDLDRWRPKVVMFENFHMTPQVHAECVDHLRTHGYDALSDGMDTLALRLGGDSAGDRAIDDYWRALAADYVPDSYGPGFPEPGLT